MRRVRLVSRVFLVGLSGALTHIPGLPDCPHARPSEPLSNPGWGLLAVRRRLVVMFANHGKRGGIRLTAGGAQLIGGPGLFDVYASQWPVPRRGGVDQWAEFVRDLLRTFGAQRVALLAIVLLTYRRESAHARGTSLCA